jgi:adenylate cyclase
MTAAGLACATCGIQLRENDKFCHECGAPIVAATQPAEFKQVTVLFADVVHSVRSGLREIMGQVLHRCAVVAQRYGGTLDKFTGDGIMALFRTPIALEDHPFRACLAALDIQTEPHRWPARSKVGTASRCNCVSG